MSPVKTAKPIEMPFALWAWAGSRNHVSHWDPDRPMRKGNFLGKDMAGHVRQHCYELCKDGEPIEMPFWLQTRVASRNHVLDPM